MSKSLLGLTTIILMTVGCEQRSRYDAGYSDGYAAGYNTECQIRATLVAGEWDNVEYSRGYREGESAGREACRLARRSP
jgi:hypothetical protein